MRAAFLVAISFVLALVVWVVWEITLGIPEEEAAEIDRVLRPSIPPDEPPAYSHCASCHLHDGMGRPDGSIPRLAGQRRTVLRNKLARLRAGRSGLPVMEPFARTLHASEIEEIARYLEGLPDSHSSGPELSANERELGRSLYAEHCSACHGAKAEGHDGLGAARLCGQYSGYVERRLREARRETRGSADAVMAGVLQNVPEGALPPIVRWLAAGECERR